VSEDRDPVRDRRRGSGLGFKLQTNDSPGQKTCGSASTNIIFRRLEKERSESEQLGMVDGTSGCSIFSWRGSYWPNDAGYSHGGVLIGQMMQYILMEGFLMAK
jgi:hypothetical protein